VTNYTPGRTHYAFPAGTDYTPFEDVLTETLVFGEESGTQMFQEFSGNLLDRNQTLSDTTLLMLLKESHTLIEEGHQIQQKIKDFREKHGNKYADMNAIIEKAEAGVSTPRDMLQKLYAQFQFAKLYKEYV